MAGGLGKNEKILEILQQVQGDESSHFLVKLWKCQASVPSFTAVNYYSTYRQNVNRMKQKPQNL